MPLPKDVYAESGFRLPLKKRESLDAAGKKIYDRLTGPNARTAAGIRGPLGIQMWVPRLGELDYDLNQFLRYETGSIDGRTRELAILVTAREMDSNFEWAAHEDLALKEGLTQEIIDIIKFYKPLTGLKPNDETIIRLGRETFTRKELSSKTYAKALKLLGPEKLVILVCLMANYANTAIKLRAFKMQLPAGKKPQLKKR